ncbi:MAG: low molecular weight phosphatase family protein [Alphaproteobacteria bacterium]
MTGRSRMGFAPPVLGKAHKQVLPGAVEPVRNPDAVLFACTFNSIRSPMAAALARDVTGGRIYVDSVGVKAEPINPFILEVMKERGIDMGAHYPKTFEDLEDTSFDLIVTLSPHAQHHAVALTDTMACDVEYWPTIDPTAALEGGSRAQKLDIFRALRDALEARIKERLGAE